MCGWLLALVSLVVMISGCAGVPTEYEKSNDVTKSFNVRYKVGQPICATNGTVENMVEQHIEKEHSLNTCGLTTLKKVALFPFDVASEGIGKIFNFNVCAGPDVQYVAGPAAPCLPLGQHIDPVYGIPCHDGSHISPCPQLGGELREFPNQ